MDGRSPSPGEPVARRPLSLRHPIGTMPAGLVLGRVGRVVAAYQVTSGTGAAVSIVVLSILFLVWVWSLFLLLVDDISIGGKLVWFLVLTCLAPVAIPVYLILRHRRHRTPAPTLG
jgi:hypothetical protein